MGSKSDIFNVSGPKHLVKVDWENSAHRGSVAASLVEGVYCLEYDRQKKRQPSEAQAPAWWEFFHFKLKHKLIDDADSSIFGAIYEFNPPSAAAPPPKAPRYAIAFRGTVFDGPAVFRDVKHYLSIIRHKLHQTCRSKVAMQAVWSTISSVGRSNVWLAGHSLGSAIATLVGKNMAKRGILLDSFLFNPPFFSNPIHSLELDEELKQGFRILHSYLTAWLCDAVNAFVGKPKSEDSFSSLSSWVPCLFVNKEDFICSEYVEYFEHRKKMEEIGAVRTERKATQNSIRALIQKALGNDSDPVHLLPSAHLAINQSTPKNRFEAHGILQWWQPNLQLDCRTYRYSRRIEMLSEE